MLYFLLYEQLYRRDQPVPRFPLHHLAHRVRQPHRAVSLHRAGPWLIGKLRQFQIGQYIREEGPKSHQKKAGTPTMGGVLIIISIVIPTLLWADLRNPYVWIAIVALLATAGSAFWTTTPRSPSSAISGSPAGARCSTSSGWRFVFAAAAAVHARLRRLHHRDERPVLQAVQAYAADPVAAAQSVDLRAGRCAVLHLCAWWWSFASNAVNLTDGLDGLAIGLMVIAAGALTVLTYAGGHAQLAAVSATGAQPAHLRADHLLRLHDRRQPGLPLVQRASGRNLHGRRRLAGAGRRAWRWWPC